VTSLYQVVLSCDVIRYSEKLDNRNKLEIPEFICRFYVSEMLICSDSYLICSCSHAHSVLGKSVTRSPGQWLGFKPLGTGTTAPVYFLKYTKGFKNDTHIRYLRVFATLTKNM
jgi:hypothetical protein